MFGYFILAGVRDPKLRSLEESKRATEGDWVKTGLKGDAGDGVEVLKR